MLGVGGEIHSNICSMYIRKLLYASHIPCHLLLTSHPILTSHPHLTSSPHILTSHPHLTSSHHILTSHPHLTSPLSSPPHAHSRALQPLVDAGYVEIVYGGADQGKYLCNHPLIADIHLTGSNYTYDAIVWGGKKEKVWGWGWGGSLLCHVDMDQHVPACIALFIVYNIYIQYKYIHIHSLFLPIMHHHHPPIPTNAQTGDPPFPKPVFGELGCCTPYIIVPGEWSDADMEYQAEMILTGVCVCVCMWRCVCGGVLVCVDKCVVCGVVAFYLQEWIFVCAFVASMPHARLPTHHASQLHTGKLHNCGHNCVAAEVLITDADWPQRQQFLDVLQRKASSQPQVMAHNGGGVWECGSVCVWWYYVSSSNHINVPQSTAPYTTSRTHAASPFPTTLPLHTSAPTQPYPRHAPVTSPTQRVPYYPASADKSKAFHTKFPNASQLGMPPTDIKHKASLGTPQPLLFQQGLTPDKVSDVGMWGGVCGRGAWEGCVGGLRGRGMWHVS